MTGSMRFFVAQCTSVWGGREIERPRRPTSHKPVFLNRDSSDDLVERRICNLVGPNFWSSLSHVRQGFQNSWMGSAVVSFCILSLIPQADSYNFCSIWGDKCEFILKAFLFSKHRDDFFFNRLREL